LAAVKLYPEETSPEKELQLLTASRHVLIQLIGRLSSP
jgi:hypothetical protein